MKKERATASSTADLEKSTNGNEKLTRTTIFLTEDQEYNLDVLALQTGKRKGELVREGISIVLEKHGFPTNQRVRFKVFNQVATA